MAEELSEEEQAEIAAWEAAREAQVRRTDRAGPSYIYHVSLRDPSTFVDQEREETAEAQWERLMTHFRRVIRTLNPW